MVPVVQEFIASLVDRTFQRANEGANRESVLVTTKAVFQKLYKKEGAESLFHLVTNEIVNQEESCILAWEKPLRIIIGTRIKIFFHRRLAGILPQKLLMTPPHDTNDKNDSV